MNALLEIKDVMALIRKPVGIMMQIPAQNGEEMFIAVMDAILQQDYAIHKPALQDINARIP